MKKTICGAVLAIVAVVAVAIGTSNPNVRPTDPAKLALARQSMMAKFHTGDADALAARQGQLLRLHRLTGT